ncbi:polysaccharide deacetylase family protein [Streptomyces sp. NPDC004726]
MRLRTLRKIQLSLLATGLTVLPLLSAASATEVRATTQTRAGTEPRARAQTAPAQTTPAQTAAAPAPTPVAPAAAPQKIVYLTFDDGPNTRYTQQILRVLAAHNVAATFFVTGSQVNAHPSTTRQTHLQGHGVQNHTWSHPDLTRVSLSRFRSEVTRTDQAIRAQTGYTPRCLRPPYGAYNNTVKSRASALGKKLRLWTLDPRDWSRPGPRTIENRVLNGVRPGTTVLLHDGGGDRSQTVAALPKIITTLKARGYVFHRTWCQ